MVRRGFRFWAATAAVAALVAACGEDAAPAATPAEYVAALADVCTGTADRLEELAQPDDGTGVGAFAAAVAATLRDEAESVRALDVPDEFDDDHRAFVRNTDDQAARWEELSTTPSSDAAFGELTRQIGELTLGRDDLVAEMGVDGCKRSGS